MSYPHRNSPPTLASRLKMVARYLVRAFAVIGFCAMLSFVLTIMTFSKANNYAPPSLPDRMILVFDFDPALSETIGKPSLGGPYLRAPVTLHEVVKALDFARKDPRIFGFVARINEGSYAVAEIQELRDAIERFRTSGNRFAHVFSESYGGFTQGTGQYYLAAAFSQVWLQPVGIVSITGLSAEVPFGKALLDRLGVRAELEHKGIYKSVPESMTRQDFSDPHHRMMRELIGDLSGQIVAGVAKDRKLDEKTLAALMDKAPLMADEALKAGLVDRLGYFDEMVDEARKAPEGQAELIKLQGYLYRMESEESEKGLMNVARSYMGRPSKGSGKAPVIALVTGAGPIVSSKSANPMDMSAERVTRAIRAAAKDEDVRAIVLRINSPGGSPSASESIRHAIVKARADGKPVVVSMGEAAASGAYWVASGADKIVAQPGTYTGSIGVFAGKVVLEGLWKKIGVNWGEVSQGQNAGMWSPNRSYTASERARLYAMLDDIYNAFLDRVAEGRKLPREKVEKIAQGYVWTGRAAKDVGLVDELGGLDRAIEVARLEAGIEPLENIRIEPFPLPKTPIEILVDMAFGSASIGFMPKAQTELLEKFASQLEMLTGDPQDYLLRAPLDF